MNSALAQRRADDLQTRLQRRLEELEQERRLSPQPPLVLGAALILPAGLISRLQGQPVGGAGLFGLQRKAVEDAAMQAVMDRERSLGYQPIDVCKQNLGWDIESAIPGSGMLRFIEVKGRIEGASTVTISKNEILAWVKQAEKFHPVRRRSQI